MSSLNSENNVNDDNEVIDSVSESFDISELTFKNNLGESLAFTRVNMELNPTKQYTEVLSTNSAVASKTIQGATPYLASAKTIAGINKQAPFGIFTATVDPATLSKLTADGTFSTIVRDGRKIIKNAGFKKISVSPANAFVLVGAAMQAMALVSGQYYMHQIHSQLTAIGELINFHHDEKTAVLLTTKERLEKISSKTINDSSDLTEIRNLLGDTRHVFYEYKTRLDREYSELVDFKYKSKISRNNLNELIRLMNQMNYTYQMCYEADKLSLQVELVEIIVQMKLGYSANQVKEKIDHLKNSYEESFYTDSLVKAKEVYKYVRTLAATSEKTKAVNRYKTILEKQKQLELVLDFNETKQVFEKILTEYERPRELIYVPGNKENEERVFVLADESY